ncbi:MAG: hypothetical protein L0G16_08070 [Weeksellaceae bacterium]|nr:hypothetical protein [Weeksellaceae bacterium]QIY84270.1 hypothetical protein HER18_12435 [Chryseobacterium sp. NEB161]
MAQKGIMLCYARLYQYKKALAVSKTVEEIALRLKDYKILSSVFSTRAVLYTNLGLYKESTAAYDKALEYAKKIDNDDARFFEMGFIYFNLAPYYQDTSLEKAVF